MTRVSVRGMTCQGCESVVETAVEMLDGVESVDADRYENVVTVTGDVTVDDVSAKIELAGYEALGEASSEPEASADDSEMDDETEATEHGSEDTTTTGSGDEALVEDELEE